MQDWNIQSVMRRLKHPKFIDRTIKEIRNEGLSALKRKFLFSCAILFTASKKAFLVALVSPIIYFLIIVSPFFRVRFGQIETRKIGHFALPIEIYLCEKTHRILNKKEIRSIDLWCTNEVICNQLLLLKYAFYFNIIPRLIGEPIFEAARLLPFGKTLLVPYRHWRDYPIATFGTPTPWQAFDQQRLLSQYRPFIHFSKAECAAYDVRLEEIGVKFGQVIITFFSRTGAFYKESEKSIRDSHIKHQLPGIMKLCQIKDMVAVRVGSVVEDRVSGEQIVDYSNSIIRSDELDLYLISRSKFMISSSSGLFAVCATFRTPCLTLNFQDYEEALVLNPSIYPIFLPKLFRHNGELLPFGLVQELRLNSSVAFDVVKEGGYEVVDNTPEEIAEAIFEMDSFVSGDLRYTASDEKLQNLFWSKAFRPNQTVGSIPRVAASFLRKYKGLLN